VNSRGEQDRRRERLDDDKIPWVTKEFAGKGCRRWKMVEGVIPAVTCGLARQSTRNRSCWMSWTPGTKRQSRIGSLGQLLRKPPGSAKPSFAHARVPLKHGRHTRVASCRTAVLGCIEVPPSSSRLTATFAPQLLLPSRLAKLVAASLSVASAAPR
jgi:hypothetical protein